MNTPFDRDDHEREWQAQERALRDERLRTDVHETDPRAAGYRLIARALRQPPPDLLPADFARQLAASAGHVPLDTRLERWLVRLLTGAMLASGLVSVLLYGPGWWDAVVGSVPQASATTINWIGAVGACMGGSWLLERMREVATHDRGVHA